MIASSRSRVTWANEMVPLSQRLTYLDIFRGAVALLVAATASYVEVEGTAGPSLLVATGIYGAITLAGGALWRLLARRSLTLFGALIIIDGIFLAWITYASGGAVGPFRYLILLHLITVTLLASYRTGLKLALWHSMLLLATFHLSTAGILPVGRAPGSEPDVAQTATFMVVFWLAALITATLAAVNERELRRRKFDVEALAAMAIELETTTDTGALAAVLIANVKRHFGPRRVVLLKTGDRRLSVWGAEGEPHGSESFAPRDASVLIEVLRQRGTVLVSELDAKSDGGLTEILPDARNLVVVPLTSEKGMIAVLVVEFGGHASRRIARRSVDMLERFGSHGALALRNAVLLEQMEQLATVDGLTGIANRRTFDDAAMRALRRAGRNGKMVSLILADIDHFKRLNDTRGHKAGDQALREVSATLSQNIRSIDTVARYGGEEFAIVLPNCPPEEAESRAEELRMAIERDLAQDGLTLSFGVATYPIHAPNADGLVRAADTALYRSKADGRNTVTLFTPAIAELTETRRPAKRSSTKRSTPKSSQGSSGRGRSGRRQEAKDVA